MDQPETNRKPLPRDIGFIGTGVMGASMAGHLLAAGHRLRVFSRRRASAQALIDRGAEFLPDPAQVAASSEVVITMVGFPHDVEQIYFGPNGILSKGGARPGGLAIDMTTSSPDLARRLYARGRERQVAVLDAPVSGGDVGAREARLSIMAGGDPDAFARARPLFELMGKTIVLQGPAGCGQFTKMANQIAIASQMMGACEAVSYATAAGLDPELVLTSIGHGAAAGWALTQLMPRALEGDLAPGFFVKHFVKDMRIAIESATALGIALPGLTQAKALYDELVTRGGENLGTQALLTVYLQTAPRTDPLPGA